VPLILGFSMNNSLIDSGIDCTSIVCLSEGIPKIRGNHLAVEDFYRLEQFWKKLLNIYSKLIQKFNCNGFINSLLEEKRNDVSIYTFNVGLADLMTDFSLDNLIHNAVVCEWKIFQYRSFFEVDN
jgi:hypothetical protein